MKHKNANNQPKNSLEKRLEQNTRKRQSDVERAKIILKEDVKNFKSIYSKHQKVNKKTRLEIIDDLLLNPDPKIHKKALNKLKRYYHIKNFLYEIKILVYAFLLAMISTFTIQQADSYAMQATIYPKMSSQLLFRLQAHLNFLETLAGVLTAIIVVWIIKLPWTKYPYHHIKQVMKNHLIKLSEDQDHDK